MKHNLSTQRIENSLIIEVGTILWLFYWWDNTFALYTYTHFWSDPYRIGCINRFTLSHMLIYSPNTQK